MSSLLPPLCYTLFSLLQHQINTFRSFHHCELQIGKEIYLKNMKFYKRNSEDGLKDSASCFRCFLLLFISSAVGKSQSRILEGVEIWEQEKQRWRRLLLWSTLLNANFRIFVLFTPAHSVWIWMESEKLILSIFWIYWEFSTFIFLGLSSAELSVVVYRV